MFSRHINIFFHMSCQAVKACSSNIYLPDSHGDSFLEVPVADSACDLSDFLRLFPGRGTQYAGFHPDLWGFLRDVPSGIVCAAVLFRVIGSVGRGAGVEMDHVWTGGGCLARSALETGKGRFSCCVIMSQFGRKMRHFQGNRGRGGGRSRRK